jgi:hypothetical protein
MPRTGLLAVVGFLVSAGQLSAAPIVEIEPNNTVAAAQGIASASFTVPPPAGVFGNGPTASITGTIAGTSPNGDVDFYSFAGLGNQVVLFDIDGTPAGSLLGLALFDPSGMFLAVSIGSDPDPGSVEFDPFIGALRLPTSGVYTIGVFDLLGLTDDISTIIPMAQTLLIRPDGRDGGVSFAPVPFTLSPAMALSDTSYTLHVSAVPEPASLILMLTGAGVAAGRAAIRRRREASRRRMRRT